MDILSVKAGQFGLSLHKVIGSISPPSGHGQDTTPLHVFLTFWQAGLTVRTPELFPTLYFLLKNVIVGVKGLACNLT